MRRLGFEPRSTAWKAAILPLDDRRFAIKELICFINVFNDLIEKDLYTW